MKPRILYVIPDYSYLTLRMLNPLIDSGFDVTVAAPFRFSPALGMLVKKLAAADKIKKLVRRYNDWQKVKHNQVKVLSVPLIKTLLQIYSDKQRHNRYGIANSFKRIIEIDVLNKTNFNEFDLVYCFDTAALLYLRRAKAHNLPTVLESRGSYIDFALHISKRINEQYGTSLNDYDNYRQDADLVQWFGKIRDEVQIADYIITYSNFHLNQFKAAGVRKEQLLRIPLGSAFQKQTAVVAKNDDEPLRFLFFGTLEYRKGIGNMVEVWKHLIGKYKNNFNATFTLIGNVFDEAGGLVNNLPSGMDYKGYMFHDELQQEIRRSHVFVFPTLNDSYAMVVQEAMSYNLPVITTKNCGAADFLEHQHTGFIIQEPFSADALQQAMEHFIETPAEVKRMSENLSQKPSYSRQDAYNYALNELKKIQLPQS